MFRKLVSNLPYSPTLINQVSFYAGRLKKEQFSRRIGVIVIVLAMLMQSFAFLSPPASAQPGCDPNDIVYCGTQNQTLLDAYRNGDTLGRTDIDEIYNRFGIGEAELAAGTVQTITSAPGNNFFSIGREAKGFSSEYSIEIEGANPVYARSLHDFDIIAGIPQSTYQATRVINNQNQEIFILHNCGNIVFTGPPPETMDPPELEIHKSINSPASGTVKPGDSIEFSLTYKNSGEEGAAFMSIRDAVPTNTTFSRITFGGASFELIGNDLRFWHPTPAGTVDYEILGPTDYFHIINFEVIVSDSAQNGDVICNQATIDAINADPDTSEEVCIPVEEEEPNPMFECVDLRWTFDEGSRTDGNFTVSGTVTDAEFQDFIINPGTGVDPIVVTNATQSGSTYTATVPFSYPDEVNNFEAAARIRTSEGTSERNGCVTRVNIEEEKTPRVVHFKRAANLTQGIDDANGTEAAAGDEIEYTLITENRGNATAVDYVLPNENIEDILDYSDVIDLGDATQGEENGVAILSWDPVTIEPGERIEKVFVVRIHDPIDNTPISGSDPSTFDLVMSNVYGSDEVEITLPKTPEKQIETAVKNLPKTGIGANVAINAILVMVVVYFYARSRELRKELKLVKEDLNYGV